MSNPAPNAPELDRENPWPGLASFTEQAREFFFGREREIDELLRLVRRQTLTVLFGQSGLGKSSLLQAGVFPLLREADFLPLYLRLDHDPASPPLADQVKAALTAAFQAAGADAPAPRSDESLWEYFHRKDIDIWSAKNRLLIPVLAFDQFEEIFTLGRAGEAARERSRAFLGELACLVENRAPAPTQERLDRGELDPARFTFQKPSCQVILSLREDFLPDLEGLKQDMPALVHNRLRLKRLTGTQALEIVTGPAQHLLSEGVAEKIVEFVAGARGGSAERLAELDVEPPLLSVICRELNDRRRQLGQARITADLVTGNRREILTDFYERSVADLPEEMRTFVEDRLLTKSGFRDNLALESALELPGVTRPLLDVLVSRRLLRIEDRLGVQRVELTHDVLAEVVLASRDDRRRRLALEDAARETRRQRGMIAGLAAIVAALCVAGIFGVRAQHRAERAAAEEARQSSQTDVVLAEQLLKDNHVREGLGYLVRAARKDARNDGVAPRLMSALAWRSFAEPVGAPLAAQGAVTRIRYSFDGKRVIALNADNRLLVWDLETGGLLATVVPSAKVVDFYLSPNGLDLAATTTDGALQIWETATGKPRTKSLRAGPPSAADLRYSPDGRWIATRSGDGTIRLWDARTGGLKFTVSQRTFAVAVDFDPSSRRLAGFSAASGVRIWSVPDGKLLMDANLKMAIGYGCFSPDGRSFALCHATGLQLFDSATGTALGPTMTKENGSGTVYAAFSPDGRKIATLNNDRTARIWDVASERQSTAPLAHDGALDNSLRFSSDGRLLLTLSADGAAHVWDVGTGRAIVEPIRMGDVAAADMGPRGAEIITGGRDGYVRRWRVTDGAAEPLRIQPDSEVINAFPSADKRGLWILSSRQIVKVDARTGIEAVPARSFPSLGPPSSVVYSEMSPDEQFLGLRATPLGVILLDLRGSHPTWRALPASNTTSRRYFTFSPDSALIAVGEGEGTIRIWDLRTGDLVREARLPTGYINFLTFFPDSRRLAISSGSAWEMKVMDVRSGEILPSPYSSDAGFYRIAFSPDGRRAAFITWANQLTQIWDTATGRPMGAPLPHREPVDFARFSADGARLLTGTSDAVRVWDARTGSPDSDPLPSGSAAASDAVFSGDGERVAVGNHAGEFRVWSAVTGQLLTEPILLGAQRGAGSLSAGTAFLRLSFDASDRFLMSGTSDLGAAVWAIPPYLPGRATPDWLLRLATAVAGGEVDSKGVFREEPSGAADLEEVRHEIEALPADAPFADWGRWFLADRATRPIAPGFSAARFAAPAR